MTSLTLTVPDEIYKRLDEIARARGTQVDRLFDDMAALMVAEADAEAHFHAHAARGQGKTGRGLELLSKAAESGDPD